MTGSLGRAWLEFVGPETTPVGSATALGLGALGAAAAPMLASSLTRPRRIALAVMAADLWGGAYVNNTRACARWYERPGQRDADHAAFAAAHLHPFVLVLLDRGSPRRVPAAAWAAAQYGYLLAATLTIRRAGRHRRVAGVLTTLGGLALDRALGPSAAAPWFAATYYPKLLLGHAAAALWTDADIGAIP